MLEVRGGIEESSTDPYSMFLFAMRSPKTREMHWKIEDVFLILLISLLELLAECSKAFYNKAKYDNGWGFRSIVQYLQKRKERVERKEISAGTMKNYFQAIRLFCDMADIPIPWKKISRERKKIRRN